MSKQIGKGTLLYFSTDPASAATDTTSIVGYVRSIDGPSAEADEVESTTLDTAGNYREFVQSLIDPGELSLELAWDPAEQSHVDLTTIHNDRTTCQWKMVLPTTDYFVLVNGWVRSFQPSVPVDDLMTASVTIRCTSQITWPTTV